MADLLAFRRWYATVRTLGGRYLPGAVLAPIYGFETVPIVQVPFERLHRHYVYVNPGELCDSFVQRALPLLVEDLVASFAEQMFDKGPGFACARYLGRMHHIACVPGRLLDVRVLRDPGRTVIESWARFVASAPTMIAESTLPEVTEFDSSVAARAFVFQVALIVGWLYQSVHSMPDNEFLTLLRFSRHGTADPCGQVSALTNEELLEARRVLDEIIMPYCRTVVERLVELDRYREGWCVRALHGDTSVKILATPRTIAAAAYAVQSYSAFMVGGSETRP